MSAKLTTRAQEAVSSAVQMASAAGNPQVEPLHLLEALLEQPEGIALSLLAAVGAQRGQVGAQVRTALVALPTSSGSSVAQPQTDKTCSPKTAIARLARRNPSFSYLRQRIQKARPSAARTSLFRK